MQSLTSNSILPILVPVTPSLVECQLFVKAEKCELLAFANARPNLPPAPAHSTLSSKSRQLARLCSSTPPLLPHFTNFAPHLPQPSCTATLVTPFPPNRRLNSQGLLSIVSSLNAIPGLTSSRYTLPKSCTSPFIILPDHQAPPSFQMSLATCPQSQNQMPPRSPQLESRRRPNHDSKLPPFIDPILQPA